MPTRIIKASRLETCRKEFEELRNLVFHALHRLRCRSYIPCIIPMLAWTEFVAPTHFQEGDRLGNFSIRYDL